MGNCMGSWRTCQPCAHYIEYTKWGGVIYSLLLECWLCLHGYLAGMEEATDHLTLVMVFAINSFIKVIK